MKIYFILLGCCLFLSCAKEASVKLPETKSLPVMYSYICPTDSVIRLKLMSSSPLFSSNEIDVLAAVSDGDVKISGAQVPFTAVPINTVTVETIPKNSQTSDRIKAFFTDEANGVNYYRIAVSHCFVYTSQTDTIVNDTRINELYSDLNHDGESGTLAGRFYQSVDSTAYYSTEYYDVFLYNCSASYYNFYKSLRNDSGTGMSFPPPSCTQM